MKISIIAILLSHRAFQKLWESWGKVHGTIALLCPHGTFSFSYLNAGTATSSTSWSPLKCYVSCTKSTQYHNKICNKYIIYTVQTQLFFFLTAVMIWCYWWTWIVSWTILRIVSWKVQRTHESTLSKFPPSIWTSYLVQVQLLVQRGCNSSRALSRVRSLEGLWLERPVQLRNIMVSPQVTQFFKSKGS